MANSYFDAAYVEAVQLTLGDAFTDSAGNLQDVTGVGAVSPDAAIVTNGQALEVPVTGTYTDTATVTVVNGVVTAIALS